MSVDFTFIKDLILSCAAITGATVAVKGLNTWRRQLTGQSEYELSRRILVNLLKYRDAINDVRQSGMWVTNPPDEIAKSMNYEQRQFYGIAQVYRERWDKVQVQKTSLYADLLEAEVIWGTTLNNLFKTVFDLERELLIRVRHHLKLNDPDNNSALKEAIRKIDEKGRDILYDDSEQSPDDFKQDLLNAIHQIEAYLKPKLSHK